MTVVGEMGRKKNMKTILFILLTLFIALDVSAQDSLGDICKDKTKEDYQKSTDHYKLLVAQNPKDQDYRRRLGMCYGKLHDFKSAIAEFDTLIALNPLYSAALSNRGIFKLFNKDEQGACEDFRKSVEIGQDWDVLDGGKKLSEYVKEHCPGTTKREP
jgi:tetratricopeptide (TPR) repeat protein